MRTEIPAEAKPDRKSGSRPHAAAICTCAGSMIGPTGCANSVLANSMRSAAEAEKSARCSQICRRRNRSLSVGNLDRKSGPRVQLEHERPAIAIQHDVDADIPKAREFVTARGDIQNRIPVRNLQAGDQVVGVRVVRDNFCDQHPVESRSRSDVDTCAHRALMQVGLAIRGSCRQSHHRHHRIAAKYDDPHVRYTLEADALEQRREAHHVFDDHHIRHTAKTELAVDGVGKMVRDVGLIEQRTADGSIAPGAAPGNDKNAVS